MHIFSLRVELGMTQWYNGTSNFQLFTYMHLLKVTAKCINFITLEQFGRWVHTSRSEKNGKLKLSYLTHTVYNTIFKYCHT